MMRDGLERWLGTNRFDSVDAIRSLKDATHVDDADALFRAQYVASLTRLRARQVVTASRWTGSGPPRNVAADGAVRGHRRRLSPGRGQPQGVRARFRRGAVRRPGLRRASRRMLRRQGWWAPWACCSSSTASAFRYGYDWYRGLTSRAGLKANIAAFCGLAAAGAATLAIIKSGAADLPESLGMFAGSGTNTPTLQAILDALGSQDAAVGYSVAYPFGVAGPILCMYVYLAFFKPAIAEPRDRRLQPVEVRVRNASLAGRPFAELQQRLPTGVHVVAIRSGGQNQVPIPTALVQADDVLMIVGTDPAASTAARRRSAKRRRVDVDRSQRPRLRPRVCVEGRRRRDAARRPEDSRRLRLQLHPRAARRRRSAARQGPGAGIRRPRRRALPAARISRPCGASSATRSRAPPTSVTSRSASARRWDSSPE